MVIDLLEELLRAHGLVTERRDDHIHILGQRWQPAIVRELEHAIQLDVRIELWPGRWLVESVTGLGTGEAARRDALNAFAIGPLHVILDAFRDGEHETWTIRGRAFDVFAGPCNVRGKPTEALAWFDSFRAFLEASDLTDGVHWIRVFHATSDEKRVAYEVLRDNERWSEAITALDTARWPTGDGFVSVRTFMIVRSGLDVTEIAACMLALDDDAICARYGDAASRHVAMIPLAFGRVLLDKLGVTYAATAIIDDREVSLADDPVYCTALAHARVVHDHGGDMFRALALRSSEIDAVNQALNRGSQPGDLILSPPVMSLT